MRLAAQDAAAQLTHRVLVLHSYRQDYRWTALVNEGILEGAALSPYLDLDYYYLDVQHKPLDRFADAHEAHLDDFFKLGYRPKTVLAVDDPAFRFVLDRRETLFKDIDIVFGGINAPAAYTPEELDSASGLFEAPDVAGNLDLIRRLLPTAKRLAVISDDTATGMINRGLFKDAAAEGSRGFEFMELAELEPNDLVRALSSEPRPDAILYLSYLRSPGGAHFGVAESLRLIGSATEAPVFACWDFVIEAGATGGLVVSGAMHGRSLAELVSEVCAGRVPPRGHSAFHSDYELFYDYQRLKAAGISPSAAGGRQLGAPAPVPLALRLAMTAMAAALVAAAVAIFLFAQSRSRLRKAEFRFRILAEGVPAAAYLVEIGSPNRREYISPRFTKLFGWDAEHWLAGSDSWFELMHPEDRERVAAAYEGADRARSSGAVEFRLRKTDGGYAWARASWDYYEEPAGKTLALGIIEDVSEAKAEEDALKKLLADRELLLKEVHHRVKNNMQIICSLLRLEAGGLDPLRPESKALADAERRVFAMALVHELLYVEERFSAIELKSYLSRLAMAVFSMEDEAPRVELDGEELAVPLDQAIPLGLICNEVLVNTVKHAFPPGFEGERTVRLALRRDGDEALIEIADSGVGLDAIRNEGRTAAADRWKEPIRSIGTTLVQVLGEQLDAVVRYERADSGTEFSLRFKPAALG
jgi:PAS domain S-box-containing protein